MLVSPLRNQRSSWMIERRCTFLVVIAGNPAWIPSLMNASRAPGASGER